MPSSTSVAVLSCGNRVALEPVDTYVAGGLRRALWQYMHIAEAP